MDKGKLYKERLLDLARKQGVIGLSDVHVVVRGPELARRLLKELVHEGCLEYVESGGFSIPKNNEINEAI